MGHTRLGKVPTTKKWQQVVAIVAGVGTVGPNRALSDDIAKISALALEAARRGLDKAVEDAGLRYTFYLLTQLVLAARSNDWQRELVPFAIQLSADATIVDLTTELQSAIDDYLARNAVSSDISEMAQQAAAEALAILAGPQSVTLFGSSREDLQLAVRKFSTKSGFSELGQLFFGRFMSRYLNFYLSRATADALGRSRVQQIGDVSAFNRALQLHCLQSALILRDFCGEWYSKTEFQRGIDLQNTSGFMAHALHKLRDELKRQGSDA